MKLSTAIRFATLTATLGLALPLTANDTVSNSGSSTGDLKTQSQTTVEAPLTRAIASGVKKDRPTITLACHRGGCSSGYSYAPQMPQYARPAPRPGARPAPRPVAQAPQVAPQPQVLQITPVVNVTPGYPPIQGYAPFQAASATQSVAAAPSAPPAAPPAHAARTVPAALADAPPPPPAAMARNVEVLLTNPESEPVAYTLNGTRFDMQPGFSQKLTNRPFWVVEFDRGGSFGTARYTLNQGTFAFVATERGWELITHDDSPAPPAPGLGTQNVARNR